MKKYSAFAIAREAFRQHTGWDRAWVKPEPKKKRTKGVVKGGMARTNREGAPKVVVIVTSDEVTHYVHPERIEVIAKLSQLQTDK